MEIGVAAKEYLIEIEVRKYTPKTIRSYRNNLNLFLRFCEEEAKISEIEDVSLAVVRRFSLYLSGKGKKGSYINGLLKVAKAFIQYSYEEGYGASTRRRISNGANRIRRLLWLSTLLMYALCFNHVGAMISSM